MGKKKTTPASVKPAKAKKAKPTAGVRTVEEQYLLARYAKLNAKRQELKEQSQKKEEKEKPKVPLKVLLEQIPPPVPVPNAAAKVKRRIPKMDELARQSSVSSYEATPPLPRDYGHTPPFVQFHPPTQTPPFWAASQDSHGAFNHPEGHANRGSWGNVLQGAPQQRGGPAASARVPRNQCILITNIDPGTDVQDVEMVFTAFGKVEIMRVIPSSKIAVVKFESFEEAELARDLTHRAIICGTPLKVEWAQPQKFQEVLAMSGESAEVQQWSTQYPEQLPELVSYEDLDPVYYYKTVKP